MLRTPTPAEYAADAGSLEDGSRPLVGLINRLRTSGEYAAVVA
ncbi:MAG: hypothetical protein ACR2JF_03055 [Iamia sp.]